MPFRPEAAVTIRKRFIRWVFCIENCLVIQWGSLGWCGCEGCVSNLNEIPAGLKCIGWGIGDEEEFVGAGLYGNVEIGGSERGIEFLVERCVIIGKGWEKLLHSCIKVSNTFIGCRRGVNGIGC